MGIQRIAKKVFLANGSLVVPAGVTMIRAILVGGGGGGGSGGLVSSAVNSGGGGGGSSGECKEIDIPVTPGQTINVVVGQGGAGASVNFNTDDEGNYGFNGTDSTITVGAVTYTARGGGGGYPGAVDNSTLTGDSGWIYPDSPFYARHLQVMFAPTAATQGSFQHLASGGMGGGGGFGLGGNGGNGGGFAGSNAPAPSSTNYGGGGGGGGGGNYNGSGSGQSGGGAGGNGANGAVVIMFFQ